MKIAIIAVVSAVGTTAFVWPKANLLFTGITGQAATQSIDSDGKDNKITNNLVVAKITSRTNVTCTYTADNGSKFYTHNTETVDVPPQKFNIVSCAL